MTEQKLKDEILNDAKKKAERIVKRAESDAKNILDTAKSEANEFRNRIISQANERAEREKTRVFSRLPLEHQKSLRQSQEIAIKKAIGSAIEKLSNSEGFDYKQSLKALLIQGANAIDEDTIVCRIRKEDEHFFTESFVKEISDVLRNTFQKSILIKIASDDTLHKSGLIVESVDGRKTFDNTYEMRLKRQFDKIRLKTAEILKLL